MLWKAVSYCKRDWTKNNRFVSRGSYLILTAFIVSCLTIGLLSQVDAQSEQQIIVTIKDFTFRTTQMPLQLHTPTVIHIKNDDKIRHDFRSEIFHDNYTEVQGVGNVSYGKGIEGIQVDPGAQVDIRFAIDRPGRYRFHCSIHPDMHGEILLVTVGAV